jgi:hypothetical protein
MADGIKKDWRELCLAVTEERDSTKLTSLVQELIEILDNGLHHSSFPLAQIGKNRKLSEN